MSEEQIKRRLAELADSEHLDYDKLIVLLNHAVKDDPENVRFSVDAGVVNRLGRELVARQQTALGELIKNAYDADATLVRLSFDHAATPGGTLTIVDNGSGMTRQDLIDGFMRLSAVEKLRYPTSQRYQRRRAGRKGIGRFAAQRLGEVLEITTQTAASSHALRVAIDWNRFEAGLDLSTIASPIQEVPKTQDYGTTLTIHNLREGWSDEQLRRSYRSVTNLIQPFPISQAHTEVSSSSDNDPGFQIEVVRNDERGSHIVADEQTEVLAYALAKIEAWIFDDGIAFYSVESKNLGIKETKPLFPEGQPQPSSYSSIRGVHLVAHYFILDPDYVPSVVRTSIKELLKREGGIRLYRNGFRVPPYGDQNNDWLELDRSEAERILLVPHGNDNFLGFVEIEDPSGELFEETASREGLIENRPLRQLRDFLYRSIMSGVRRIGEERGRHLTRADSVRTGAVIPLRTDRFESLLQEISRLKADDEPSQSTYAANREWSESWNRSLTRVEVAIRSIADEDRKQTEALLQERDLLRILASLGLLIGEFTHEVRQTLGAAMLDAQTISEVMEGTAHEQHAEDLLANLRTFHTYVSYFHRAVADNASREISPQNIRAVVRQFTQTVAPAASRNGIEVATEFNGMDLVSTPMHSSEWASVLFNFYTNAVKAIQRKAIAGRIIIRSYRQEELVVLEFADNGIGITEGDKSRVFDAFFTTTVPSPRLEQEASGMGLGLKIVRDIAISRGGSVELINAPNGFSTCFRFSVPAST